MDLSRLPVLHRYFGPEHDACAIYAAIAKLPLPPDSEVRLWYAGLNSLDQMDHRAGWIDGRSDGTGILVDIPRQVWQQRLRENGLEIDVNRPEFWVLTLAVPVSERRDIRHRVAEALAPFQFRWLLSHAELTDGTSMLDAHALWYAGDADALRRNAFLALEALERAFPLRIASFSPDQTVLKVTQAPGTLRDIIAADWGGASFNPRCVIGHNRFSTNTSTDLARVQPFLGLAHNGEINTVDRLQREMLAHGISPVTDGSDSQNLDRLIWALVYRDGLSHAEAVRLAISPSPALLSTMGEAERAAWQYLQAIWGPYAEGPAAIVHRLGSSVVGAVDAMGLRPLWLLETRDYYVLSSEPSVVPVNQWIREPRSIGPGELIALEWDGDGPVQLFESSEVFRRLMNRVPASGFGARWEDPLTTGAETYPAWQLVADGWHKDDQALVQAWAEGGHEPIGSLGYDGPLAPFADGPTNLSDYLQETVAVVTNPALDREREGEHFRLETFLGCRPDWNDLHPSSIRPLWLAHPWLSEAGLAAVQSHFGAQATVLPLARPLSESELDAAERLAREAVAAVRAGSELVILDDAGGYRAGVSVTLDPTIAVAAIDRLLRRERLRRRMGLVVRSGMIRHLHDAIILLGLGANALDPYLLWSQIPEGRLGTAVNVMNSGLQKVLSTMGIHELSGYGHVFSAIGLPHEIAEVLGITSFAAPSYADWAAVRAHLTEERLGLIGQSVRVAAVPRATPHIYKAVDKLASGTIDGLAFRQLSREIEAKHVIALRHTLGFAAKGPAANQAVSLAVGDHDLPFLISSMSFGSQGETAFRSYAEAARRLNMLSMNGEGGEILDMIGRYYQWRGYQVASGRFGINTKLLNGAQYAEIKIGQGAKPGEGGHLPGKKVSRKVAQARSAVPGIDLISPSNNHDLYSIEDLKQLIEELKEANPALKVIVKVPVVPNIGTIAVGIVKAGADVITLSGFEGGTGAARLHALRHVGLPADIGVPLTHTALTLAGLRDRVEIWCDGGFRNADDVTRMILLGANRVGFATLAMVALGCTICRSCQSDTCHVGIATQIDTVEEAAEKGIKRFHPQEYEPAVANLVRFFTGLAEGVRENLRLLGFSRVTDAVGQSHLLTQERHQETVGYLHFIHELAELVQSELASRTAHAAVGYADPRGFDSVGVSTGRSIGTGLSGQRIRKDSLGPVTNPVDQVAGQGFGAFLSEGVTLIAHGGAQDGVGKGASGGTIAVLKARGADGRFYGGHAGKSIAYGAQGGTFIIQGSTDARAGIRLAGADLIILGDGLPSPKDARHEWDSATIKGFGFEYMTRGRGLILGDPGPWLASGMTGGTLFLRLAPDEGLTQEFLASRLAAAAKVSLQPVGARDAGEIRDLLGIAIAMMESSEQTDRAERLRHLAADPERHFIKVVPVAAQTDPNISTE